MGELRVIIAGGGTGGHIFPAIAIGQALLRLRPGTLLLFVGAEGKMEMEKVPQAGFEIVGLPITGFNRAHLLRNLTLPLKILRSRAKANKIIRDFQPSVAVGVGGFASFPLLNAAQAQGVPTLIQEQNSYAGKTNKILGRKAKAVCVAYGNMNKFFPAEKIIITGNPVRKVISGMQIAADEARARFGLKPGITTVLVVGGSLGARTINETIEAGLKTILAEGVQVLWQTGKTFIDKANAATAGFSNQAVAMDFIKDMEYAYSAADVIVSRAGALAIAEICIAAKPVVFVPFPFAAEDHQTSNAMALVNQGAAFMVTDANAPKELTNVLVGLLRDKQKQESMSENLKALAITNADERIAHKIIAIAETV